MKRDKQILLVCAIFVLAGLLISCYIDYNISTTPSLLAGTLIGVGLVGLAFEFFATKRLIDDVSSQICHKINLPLEAFYQNRNELKTHFADEFEDKSEVWIAWHTGSKQFPELFDAIKQKKIKTKIIVTNPVKDPKNKKSDFFNKIAQIGMADEEVLRKSIIAHTKEALKLKGEGHDIELKWYDGFIGNTIIIENPKNKLQKSKTWARVELVVPYEARDKRPNIKISQLRGQEVLQTYIDSYEKLWENYSKDPPANIS